MAIISATGPEHYTEKEAEKWRAIGLFLCENFPGRFRAGEWNAFISCCIEEECLAIGSKAAEAETHKARSSGITGAPSVGRREGV